MSFINTLTRDKTTGAYYTRDQRFKIHRCSVRAYGWDISMRRNDGTYRICANAETLPEARKMIDSKGNQNVDRIGLA